MATKPLRPAPPPPVPKASAHSQLPSLAQRDSNNNKNERKNGTTPSRPTVIRPKVVHTPKKKPPPRPPPPKVGAFRSQGNPVQNESHSGGNAIVADIDTLFGTAVKKDGTSWTAPNGTSSLFSRRTGLVRGQLNLFGSTGKGQQKGSQQPVRKGPAPRQPTVAAAGSGARSSFRKGTAPAPPVPPHRSGSSAISSAGKDSGSLLISFDSPPASPTCSVASGSSGASSAASVGHGVGNGAPVSLLDLDVPPLQDIPWSGSRGLSHSRTTFWGPSHEGGAGDATPLDDAWNFPRNTSLPSLSQEASLPSCDPWNFPETDDSSPSEEWSPPPPMHPPPALPAGEISAQQDLSGAAVAKQDYQSSAPGQLSLKVHDLIALISEEGPEWYRGRCGNEEGLVPKRCLDVLVPPRKSSAENGVAVTCRRALYDFEAESSQELSLRQGDTVRLLGVLDNDWALGEVHGKRGRFPLAFLEPEAQPAGCPAIALYSFNAEQDGDLGFAEGDTVVVLSRINKDWLYGEHAGRRGQFPASFVQPISKNTSTKGVDIYRAAFAFEAQHADELTLRPGDKVQVTSKVNSDWWQGRLLGSASSEGIFPAAFVESLS